ncbi:MAG: polyprenol monophosphomannose synthase [Chloroflexi bacterium]|nr:polyprenol monophosphomannose synthase [Chloroflexota bacterium]
MPTYNEADNLEIMVTTLLDKLDWPATGPVSLRELAGSPEPETSRAPEDIQVSILVVDDNSPDGTGDLAERIARERPGRLHILHRAGKLGLGTAYIAGFSLALERGADVVFEMDADFSHSPEYLPQMLRLLNENDVVVGSRWAPGGKLDENWPLWRYLLSKYANLYARWVTGLPVYDPTAGFKAYRAAALRKLPLHRVRSDGYAFQIEVAMACHRYGLKVAELPIYFEERVRGTSKMSLKIITEATWRVWQIRSRW